MQTEPTSNGRNDRNGLIVKKQTLSSVGVTEPSRLPRWGSEIPADLPKFARLHPWDRGKLPTSGTLAPENDRQGPIASFRSEAIGHLPSFLAVIWGKSEAIALVAAMAFDRETCSSSEKRKRCLLFHETEVIAAHSFLLAENRANAVNR